MVKTIAAGILLLPGAVSALTTPASSVFKIQSVAAPEGAPKKGWQVVDPDEEPDETTPGAPERSGFWDRLQDKGFDSICKNIKLRAKQKRDLSEFGAGGVTIERRLLRTAAGTFALLDRTGLEFSLGYGHELFDLPTGPVSISFGSSIRGESIVVRPLASKKACSELGTLLKVYDLKTAIPLSQKRILAMQVGEVWKLPLTLYLGGGIGTGYAFENMPASISLGRGKESRAAVTLYRMAEDKLRFRLRIDRADIKNKGGSIVYSFPGSALGLPQVETIIVSELVKLVNKEVARQISRYLTGNIGLAGGKREGRQIMIEFVLDPRDAPQMNALRSLMQGDLNAFSVLKELLRESSLVFKKDRDAREEASELRDRHAGDLDQEASYVGADDYERDNSHFRIKIPILIDWERGKGREADHIVVVDDAESQFDVYKSDKRSETGLIDIPFLGEYTKHNTQRTAQVITTKKKGEQTTEPVAVFVHQEGFLRETSTSARRMVSEADEITRRIGTKGEGVNRETSLPVDELFPEEDLYLPEGENPHARHEFGPSGPTAKSYHRGVSAFTLVFNSKAIQDIIAAPVELIWKAYLAVAGAEERMIVEKVLPIGTLRADGALDYSVRDARKALGLSDFLQEDQRDTMAALKWTAHTAAMIVRDLRDVLHAPTAQERAQRFLAVMSGDGESGLAYEEVLKVLVQLADPADIAGEFFVRVDKKRKGEKDTHTRLVLNDHLNDGSIVSEASTNRARFAEPSILTD